jgi:hypothetical protein
VLGFLQKQHAFNRNLLFDSNDAAEAVSAVGSGWKGGVPLTLLIGMYGKVLYSTQGDMDPLVVQRALLKNLPNDRYAASRHTGIALSKSWRHIEHASAQS